MKPYYERDNVTVYNGDCLDVMAGLPANSVDTVITDPPYGLQFMGSNWDHGVPGVAFWIEALRVAKPGATMLAFGGTRTHHRLICAIEDADWEIRDVIMWVYGQGIALGHNVSKGIDKAAGAKRGVVGENPNARENSISSFKNDGRNIKKPLGGEGVTIPATDLAKDFDGWNSRLKPSYEPIIVAQKPIDKNYANNAAVWGVAGLNIDGARIETENDLTRHGQNPLSADGKNQGYRPKDYYEDDRTKMTWGSTNGRFPSNFVHDGSPEVMKEFERSPKVQPCGTKKKTTHTDGMFKLGQPGVIYKDKSDSPSRFFQKCPPDSDPTRFRYCPKASKKDRGNGNSHPTVKPQSLLRYLCRLTKTPYGGIILDPFAGSGSTGLAARAEGRPCILIEKEADYCEIIVNRLNNEADVSPKSKRVEANKKPATEQLKLF